MDITFAIKALILGIVEDLTEFPPISSTGRPVLAGQLLDFNDEKGKILEIVIRFGAILAVCWESRHEVIDVIKGLLNDPRQQRFVTNVIVTTVPAITLALIFGRAIKAHLLNPIAVASVPIIGGFVILWAEWYERHRGEAHDPRANALLEAVKAGTPYVETLDDLHISDAVKVGFARCFVLISGTSRSGSTIIGDLLFELSHKVVTEFPLFLTIPMTFGATAYELYKSRTLLSVDDPSIFTMGFVTVFVSALFCIRWLLKFITTHDFHGFIQYRIIFGVIMPVTAYIHLVVWQVVSYTHI